MIHYEGSDIVVHHMHSKSDFVCITFPPIGYASEAKSSFFAKNPLEKSGISSIGVMSKKENWFYTEDPSEETDAINAILELTRKYAHTVIFAASMGAHAALRYSSRLSAKAVFVLGPKWSIDPAMFSRVPAHLVEAHFRPWMKGMALHADATRNVERVYLGYDPQDAIDSAHAEKIISVIPNVISIKFPHAGHYLPPVLSGTNNLENIIYGLRELPSTSFVHLVQKIRRRHINMLRITVARFAKKHPYSALRLLMKISASPPEQGRKGLLDRSIVARLLFSLRSDERATDRCLDLLDQHRQPSIFQSLRRPQSSATHLFNLLTSHGHIVAYSPHQKRLMTVDPAHLCGEEVPVLVSSRDRDILPYIEIYGRKLYLSNKNEQILVAHACDFSARLIESLNEQWKHLRSSKHSYNRIYLLAFRSGFACFHPDKSTSISDRDMEWEALALIPALDTRLCHLEPFET